MKKDLTGYPIESQIRGFMSVRFPPPRPSVIQAFVNYLERRLRKRGRIKSSL